MNQTLFNPFLRVAGSKSLLLGLLASVLTALLASVTHCHFDGALDAHFGANAPLWVYFAEILIAWICLSVFFYVAGLIFSKSSIRLIDVAGTTLLSRWPMFFVALLGFFPMPKAENIHQLTPSLIVLILGTICFSVWTIALLYNAFTVSCNIKGTKANVSFIASLILAELVSKLLVFQLYTIAHIQTHKI